ncbi:MAG TPA: hypothetical protein VGQ86_08215 [Candidatus Limnocylindria bacterium]|jgi:predicted transcriptional regulator|nr:hypothetical protein [Candidatus Limnocylindria bacterium]
MKTAISLPEEIFVRAERLARRLKKSRSKLYSDAIAEYLARHDRDVIVDKLNEVWDGVPQDEFGAVAARRGLERSDW